MSNIDRDAGTRTWENVLSPPRLRLSSVTESVALRLIQSGEPMCDQCQQLDTRIQRYRGFVKAGLGDLTIERIKELIEELQRRKEAMH